jgi:hypothetical protein
MGIMMNLGLFGAGLYSRQWSWEGGGEGGRGEVGGEGEGEVGWGRRMLKPFVLLIVCGGGTARINDRVYRC